MPDHPLFCRDCYILVGCIAHERTRFGDHRLDCRAERDDGVDRHVVLPDVDFRCLNRSAPARRALRRDAKSRPVAPNRRGDVGAVRWKSKPSNRSPPATLRRLILAGTNRRTMISRLRKRGTSGDVSHDPLAHGWYSPAEPPGTAYVQALALSPTDQTRSLPNRVMRPSPRSTADVDRPRLDPRLPHADLPRHKRRLGLRGRRDGHWRRIQPRRRADVASRRERSGPSLRLGRRRRHRAARSVVRLGLAQSAPCAHHRPRRSAYLPLARRPMGKARRRAPVRCRRPRLTDPHRHTSPDWRGDLWFLCYGDHWEKLPVRHKHRSTVIALLPTYDEVRDTCRKSSQPTKCVPLSFTDKGGHSTPT